MHSINYKWNNLLIILEIFFKSKKYREIREPKSVLAVSKMTAGESSEGAGRNLKWLCRSVSPPNVSANPRWIYRDGGNRLFLALFKGLDFLSGFFPPFPGKHLYIFTHIFTASLHSPSPVFRQSLLRMLGHHFVPWLACRASDKSVVGSSQQWGRR